MSQHDDPSQHDEPRPAELDEARHRYYHEEQAYRTDAYLPDGTPADGPVTTAQDYAEQIAGMSWPLIDETDMAADIAYTTLRRTIRAMYRAEAHREGDLYAEAIRGGRRLRILANIPRR